MTIRIPHPFPYQGSKRSIVRHILPYVPSDTHSLIEPFCGSAAFSIAAAAHGMARKFALNDVDESLMKLWSSILESPTELLSGYETLWNQQLHDRRDFYFHVRDEFNVSHQPHHLLYLLARIVKGSVRYSGDGRFNQSPDNRRNGMHPAKMRRQILAVSELLGSKTSVSSADFQEAVRLATESDLVYLDPPYQGTSFTRDHRYIGGLHFDELVDVLTWMNDRRLAYILSYDGRTGEKEHGKGLPESLGLTRLHIRAGRSSQATLLGANQETVESLYLSSALVQRLRSGQPGFTQALLV